MAGFHLPVMLAEVLRALAPASDELYLDGTFGAGGYSRAVLEAADCRVIGLDRDPDAANRAEAFAQEFAGRFQFLDGEFGVADQLLRDEGLAPVDGVMLDIGVSSFQLDEGERGFSFRSDGPLDMRMSQEGESAADVVNHYEESEIADLLYHLGEERKSRPIAAAIVRARADAPITRTLQLADIVESVLGRPRPKPGGKTIHPATRTFQALRIHVNDELGELERGLQAAENILKPGGRLVVVTFHSLEDRIVKNFLTERAGRLPAASRHQPVSQEENNKPTFHLIKKGTVKPSDQECKANPRARSAKLRWAVRTDAPGWEGAA